jgi:antagonist of KipI
MSLTIIKAGILDTIQDTGRYGFQSSGINPGGVMDCFSARLANCLLGKDMDSAIIELHFPAAEIQINEATIICITGADFFAKVDDNSIPLNQPVVVNKGSVLKFTKVIKGSRCYFATLQNFHLTKWLNSYNTNVKAQAGGFEGRALRHGDLVGFKKNEVIANFLAGRNLLLLPWKAQPAAEIATTWIELIPGPEWHWLDEDSRHSISRNSYRITNVADRMGYRLEGPQLKLKEQKQLVSSGVSFGTVQLLPNGQLIVLMADHQTIGGYPRVANVISAHLPALAQMQPNEELRFKLTSINYAERKLVQQHNYLVSVQHASSLKLKNLFS